LGLEHARQNITSCIPDHFNNRPLTLSDIYPKDTQAHRLTHLLIRNYEPPKTPVCTAAASQVPLMDLFGVEVPA